MSVNTLVVDLDDSLLKIDLFKERLLHSILKHPKTFFKTIFLVLKSKSIAKIFISNKCKLDIKSLPFNNKVIDAIIDYKSKGYYTILASGAPYEFVNPIADHLQLFDKVIATDKKINNIGSYKLESIKEHVTGDFIYIGDSFKDLPIWIYCKKAILIGNNIFIKKKLRNNNVRIIEIMKSEKNIFSVIIKQLRVYQWIKNLLLFVPALASHQLFSKGVFINSLVGFCAFSLLASSIYVFNDIIDLDNDRKHPDKKNRPIANGDLTLFNAYAIMVICLILGGLLANSLGTVFFSLSIGYIILNLLYSFYLKKLIVLDVILLMVFYALRLIAGHIPNSIPFSPWLLSFSIFLFFSLGLMKRYIDIITMETNKKSKLDGRGYTVNDRNILMSIGVGSGLLSTLVLILYTGSEQVQEYYATPMILVSLAPLLLYWISRMWFLAERGIIKSDPILFTLKDVPSYIVAFFILLIMLISNYLLF